MPKLRALRNRVLDDADAFVGRVEEFLALIFEGRVLGEHSNCGDLSLNGESHTKQTKYT